MRPFARPAHLSRPHALLALALLGGGALAFGARAHTQIVIGLLTVPLLVLLSGYMAWPSLRERASNPAAARSALLGALEGKASLGGLLAGQLLWAVAYVYFGGLMVDGGTPGPAGAVQLDRFFGAVNLLALATLHLSLLMGFLVVRRHGLAPPVPVLRAWLVGYAALASIVGSAAAVRLSEWLRPAIALEGLDYLHLVPVSTAACVVCLLWLQQLFDARWQRRLADQAARIEVAEMGRKLAEAQLAMLQAQIEPHFLYNTLASVQFLLRHDAAASDYLLTQLIRYLRHAMPRMRQSMSAPGRSQALMP